MEQLLKIKYNILCSKAGLKNTLIEYCQNSDVNINLENLIPKTYSINYKTSQISQQEQTFLDDNQIKTCLLKPINGLQGIGIDIIPNVQNDFKKNFIQQKQEIPKGFGNQIYKDSETHIIQEYIEPALLQGNKFDIRCFILVLSIDPLFVLYHPGYCRRSLFAYKKVQNNNELSKLKHLTNQQVQRNHPKFEDLKEETIWSWEKAEKYWTDNKLKTKQELEQMHQKIKLKMMHVYKAGAKKLKQNIGQFELMGGDIILDSNFEPLILEINSNPSLTIDTQQQHITKPIIYEVKQKNQKENVPEYLYQIYEVIQEEGIDIKDAFFMMDIDQDGILSIQDQQQSFEMMNLSVDFNVIEQNINYKRFQQIIHSYSE